MAGLYMTRPVRQIGRGQYLRLRLVHHHHVQCHDVRLRILTPSPGTVTTLSLSHHLAWSTSPTSPTFQHSLNFVYFYHTAPFSSRLIVNIGMSGSERTVIQSLGGRIVMRTRAEEM